MEGEGGRVANYTLGLKFRTTETRVLLTGVLKFDVFYKSKSIIYKSKKYDFVLLVGVGFTSSSRCGSYGHAAC